MAAEVDVRPSLPTSLSTTSIEGLASRSSRAPLGQFEVPVFRTYLERLLPLVVGASLDDLADSLFSSSDFGEKVTKFGTDPSSLVLYVNKIREPLDDVQGVEDVGPTFSYTLSTEMVYSQDHASTVAFIKRIPTLDTLRPLDDRQLHFLNLFGPASSDRSLGSGTDPSGVNPYEDLHSLVSLVVAPYFDAYVNSKGNRRMLQEGKAKDADAKMGIPMTKRKFAELELSLLHLQQNVEIPEISLPVHPVVRAAVEKCRTEGVRVSPDVIDHALLSDDAFLNKIQAEVNSWIKEIQNVTKLNRDVASGTASQEINFWLSMEKALEGIEDQLKSEPISPSYHLDWSLYSSADARERSLDVGHP